MPWIEALSDTQQLRRFLRDLIALVGLPAVWNNLGPSEIANGVAAALVAMLDAELVYVVLGRGMSEAPTEIAQTTTGAVAADAVPAIRASLLRGLPRGSDPIGVIPNPVGKGRIRITSIPIGIASDATIVVGSVRSDFPSETQRLLLSIAASQTAVALHHWQAVSDERRFLALVERSSDFIAVASLEGIPQYINPAGLDLVGLDSLAEAKRAQSADFIQPEEVARLRDEIWPLVIRQGRWRGEVNFRHFKTGAEIAFLVDSFRIDDVRTGMPLNVAMVSRDLTEQKRAEAELRHLTETLAMRVSERTRELESANRNLMEEKRERERTNARLDTMQLELFHAARFSVAGEMCAALAHELSQPLTAATNSVNAARRLLSDQVQPEVAAVIEEMAEQVIRATEIIHRLRQFMRRGVTERRNESINVIVEDATAFATIGDAALDVVVTFSGDPRSPQVNVDRVQIQQVVANLIRNALDAVVGASRRELALSTILLADARVQVSIADTGTGISKEVSDRLFEPFFSTKRAGMGLGLSISRSIVQAHGGTLEFEPNESGGATFRFTLPGPAKGDDVADDGVDPCGRQ